MSYNTNATDDVFNFIVEEIQRKEWPSDSKIWSEAELCSHLNVSRVAVRQAIDKLTTLSILRKIQGSGTYVENVEDFSLMSLPFFQMSSEDIIHILEFRRYFDSSNVELFIERADDEEIQELEDVYEKMQLNADNSEKFYFYDYKFHNIIAKGTKNPFVIKISNIFVNVFETHQRMLFDSVGPEHGLYDHKLILKYIKEHNVEMAVIYTKYHIDYSIKACKEYFKNDKS